MVTMFGLANNNNIGHHQYSSHNFEWRWQHDVLVVYKDLIKLQYLAKETCLSHHLFQENGEIRGSERFNALQFHMTSFLLIAVPSTKLSQSSNLNNASYSHVGYKQSDQVWRNVVKDRVVNLYFGEDFTLREWQHCLRTSTLVESFLHTSWAKRLILLLHPQPTSYWENS